MIRIDVKELKSNLDFYLAQVGQSDFVITDNNETLAVLINPEKYKKIALESVRGILPEHIDTDQILKERLALI